MEEKDFPREVNMEKAGIGYVELGPNIISVHIVQGVSENGEPNLQIVFSMSQTELGCEWNAMLKGNVLTSITLKDALDTLKPLEDMAGATDEYREDGNTDNAGEW